MSTTVEPAELSYPDKPDANGYAKKYFKRRAFYFGAYNTPESFQLFGEWKRQLIESGQAPEVKAVRKDLAHQLAPKTPSTDDHVERLCRTKKWNSFGGFVKAKTASSENWQLLPGTYRN